ncbi:MAG: hypothetical protein IPO49_00305 [Bacteroidetes bacterium]|nr:hypothetical protein [Bacteroidota bacterium]
MELDYTNFQDELNAYNQLPDLILAETNNKRTTNKRISVLNRIFAEYQNLDVKMRLAFGIQEIRLNNHFVTDKEGDLKECHLFYYKLADLWFAYETYIKFYKFVTGQTKKKIVWLDEAVYNPYSTTATITQSLTLAQTTFTSTYNTKVKRDELIEYLKHCELQAEGQQKTRLAGIIIAVRNSNFNFSHTNALTIAYAIRNNFVHNGETTVVPDNFGFRNKVRMLRILYPYLCLILLKSINITCRNLPRP